MTTRFLSSTTFQNRDWLRQLLAFLTRDFYTEISYRTAFGTGIVGILFRVFVFYYLSFLVDGAASAHLEEYNGDYFVFVLIGIALSSYFSVGLTGFAQALRQAQTTGTLEALLMTPTPVSFIVVGSALWSYTYTTFRVFVYLATGVFLLGADLSNANWSLALVSLLVSIVAFASIGIITAGVIMVIKRGEPLTALLSNLASLVGGVFYPIEVLPDWLQPLANLLPITYSLRAMRLALLNNASWSEVAPDLLALCFFCVVLFPLSLFIFRFAVDRARSDGSLAHY